MSYRSAADPQGDFQPFDDKSVSLTTVPVKMTPQWPYYPGDIQPFDDKSEGEPCQLSSSKTFDDQSEKEQFLDDQYGEHHGSQSAENQSRNIKDSVLIIQVSDDCDPSETEEPKDIGVKEDHECKNPESRRRKCSNPRKEIIDIKEVRKLVKRFSEKRSSLHNKTKFPERLASAIGAAGGALMEAYKWANSTKGKLDVSEFSSHTDFSTKCSIALEKLEVIVKHYGKTKAFQELEKIKTHLKNRRVIITFYGDTNVGKSTLLNSIMGDKYLPMDKQPQTAAFVYIKFVPEGYISDEKDLDYGKGILRIDNGTTVNVFKGAQDIKHNLSRLDQDMREVKIPPPATTTTHVECTICVQHSLANTSSQAVELCLLDSPGCNEFGSDFIAECVTSAREISSAFIFVTTFEDYRKLQSSKILESLYKENTELLKQNRLTIVINKKDSAISKEEEESEKSYTSEEVISDVRNFLCTSVFKCSQEDLPKDSVVLVCGSWALNTRICKTSSMTKLKEKSLKKAIRELSQTTLIEMEEEIIIRKEQYPRWIQSLEEHSNIKELEERLEKIAQSSFKMWKQKMRSDLLSYFQFLINELSHDIVEQQAIIKDLRARIQEIFKVFTELNDSYSEIIDNEKICRKKTVQLDWELFIEFKQAFDQDMEAEDLQKVLMEVIHETITDFKVKTSSTIAKGRYGPEDFIDDLGKCWRNLSTLINQAMVPSDNLTMKYSERVTNCNMTLQRMKDRLMSIQHNQTQDNLQQKPIISTAKITAPTFAATINIPVQLTGWQEFLKMIKELFKLQREDPISLVLELGVAEGGHPGDSSKSEDLNQSLYCQKEEETNINESPETSKKIDSDAKSLAVHENATVKEKTELEKDPSEPNTSCDISNREDSHHKKTASEHGSASSLNSDSSGRKRLYSKPEKIVFDDSTSSSEKVIPKSVNNYYKKWTPTMEDIVAEVLIQVQTKIRHYFKHADRNILMKCCEQYYENAVSVLKSFDTAESAAIENSLRELQQKMDDYDQRCKLVGKIKDHLERVVDLNTAFSALHGTN